MFPQVPIPDSELWNLYPSLGIIILVMIVVSAGLLIIWREYKLWAREQDKKRADERATQRAWEEEQDKLRDSRWQDFIQAMSATYEQKDKKNRGQIADMAKTLNQLSVNSVKTTEAVGLLSVMVQSLKETLTGHIAVDDARFEVLLSPVQKTAFQEKIGLRGDHHERIGHDDP